MHSKEKTIDLISRRNFLGIAGMAPVVLAAGEVSAPLAAHAAEEGGGRKRKGNRRPAGLELYSVRNELQRDLPSTLRAVSKMGYEVVEFYAPYASWTFPQAKNVRAQLDDLGLRCYSTHNHLDSLTPEKSMAKAIELNQILGCRYIVLASAGNVKGLEGWKTLCERLTGAVNELKVHGLSAGFHNHQTEWSVLPGTDQRIMDVIAANTPPEFVLQFDVGTCLEAGSDPIAWIQGNPGRIKSVHLKDWAPGSGKDKGYRVLFGEGAAPWKELLSTLETVGGVEYYLIEQEGSRYSELETAERCLEAFRKLRPAA